MTMTMTPGEKQEKRRRPGPPAVPVRMTTKRKRKLLQIIAAGTSPQRLVLRARIALAAGAGDGNEKIARDLGCSVKTAREWRGRFAVRGVPGIFDKPRSGRPETHGPSARLAVVAVATSRPGRSHRSGDLGGILSARCHHRATGSVCKARAREVGRSIPWRLRSRPMLVADSRRSRTGSVWFSRFPLPIHSSPRPRSVTAAFHVNRGEVARAGQLDPVVAYPVQQPGVWAHQVGWPPVDVAELGHCVSMSGVARVNGRRDQLVGADATDQFFCGPSRRPVTHTAPGPPRRRGRIASSLMMCCQSSPKS